MFLRVTSFGAVVQFVRHVTSSNGLATCRVHGQLWWVVFFGLICPEKTFSPLKMLDWWDDWCTRAALNGSGGLSGSWIETLRENIIIIQMVPVFEIDSSTCWGLCKSIPVRVFSFFHTHILQIYTAVSYLNSTETTKTKFTEKLQKDDFVKKRMLDFQYCNKSRFKFMEIKQKT